MGNQQGIPIKPEDCTKCYNHLKSYGIDCPKNCDYTQAKKIMRKLMIENHPDKHPEDPKKYTEIFSNLSNCNDLIIKEQCMEKNNSPKKNMGNQNNQGYSGFYDEMKKQQKNNKQNVRDRIVYNSYYFKQDNYSKTQEKKFHDFMKGLKPSDLEFIDRKGYGTSFMSIRSTKNLGHQLLLKITVYNYGNQQNVSVDDPTELYAQKYNSFDLYKIFNDYLNYFDIKSFDGPPYWKIGYNSFKHKYIETEFWDNNISGPISENEYYNQGDFSEYDSPKKPTPKKSPGKSPKKSPKSSPSSYDDNTAEDSTNRIKANAMHFKRDAYFKNQNNEFYGYLKSFDYKDLYFDYESATVPTSRITIMSTDENLGDELELDVEVDIDGRVHAFEEYVQYEEGYDSFNLYKIFMDFMTYLNIKEYATAPYWRVSFYQYSHDDYIEEKFWDNSDSPPMKSSPMKSPSPRKSPKKSPKKPTPKKSPLSRKSPKKSPKKTIKQIRAECKEQGLVYDVPTKKCRENKKKSKRKSPVRKSPARKSKARRVNRNRKSPKKSPKRSPKKTIKQIRAECKEQGLVYDVPTKKCRENMKSRRNRKSPMRKSKAKRANRKTNKRNSKECPPGTVISPSGRCIKIGGAAYKKYFGKS
jgi:hypothetical protein